MQLVSVQSGSWSQLRESIMFHQEGGQRKGTYRDNAHLWVFMVIQGWCDDGVNNNDDGVNNEDGVTVWGEQRAQIQAEAERNLLDEIIASEIIRKKYCSINDGVKNKAATLHCFSC